MAGLRFVFRQKSDSGNDHPGFVRGSAGRRDCTDADFRRSDSRTADRLVLGWMRAAPAVGAFAMALVVAHLPPMKQTGKTLLWCVSGFGIATILFGLSRLFWLSLG